MKGYYNCRKKKHLFSEGAQEVMRDPVMFIVPNKDYNKIAKGKCNCIMTPVEKGIIGETEVLVIKARLHKRCCIIETSEDDCTIFDISEDIVITDTEACTPIKKKAIQVEWYEEKAFILFE